MRSGDMSQFLALIFTLFRCLQRETDENDRTLVKWFPRNMVNILQMNLNERSLAHGCLLNGLRRMSCEQFPVARVE